MVTPSTVIVAVGSDQPTPGQHDRWPQMPSADQIPVKKTHSMMRWHLWIVLIADRPALQYVLFALPTFTSPRGRRDLGYAASATGSLWG